MAMKLGTIKKEAAACRKAFKGSKIGDPVWLLHHGRLTEILDESAENRIKYILAEKSIDEQALRLREFRPVKDKVAYAKWEAELDAVYAKWWAEWNAVNAKWQTERDAVYAKWWAELDAVNAKWRAERDAVYAKWEAELDAVNAKLTALHLSEYPDTAWNGKNIFHD
jgi:hypothetical protein